MDEKTLEDYKSDLAALDAEIAKLSPDDAYARQSQRAPIEAKIAELTPPENG